MSKSLKLFIVATLTWRWLETRLTKTEMRILVWMKNWWTHFFCVSPSSDNTISISNLLSLKRLRKYSNVVMRVSLFDATKHITKWWQWQFFCHWLLVDLISFFSFFIWLDFYEILFKAFSFYFMNFRLS